jgi:hypothetical protein
MGFGSAHKSRSDKPARCAAAGPIRRGLLKALRVVQLEFRLLGELPELSGATCVNLRKDWDLKVPIVMQMPSSSRGGRTRKRVRLSKMSSALKSCKRIFDAPCITCDHERGEEAKGEWAERMAETPDKVSTTWCRDPYWLLRRHVRSLAHGWGERLENARKECVEGGIRRSESGVYVPDQQGCLEVYQGNGGTLAADPSKCSSDNSLVRLGVAKTKGKLRVVTMQSARVKRVLTPVHNALYDHLSAFGWLVRGDVKKEDFLKVISDRQPGEAIISGDYDSATDRIYLEAVSVIIDELSKDVRMTDEERKVLVESFADLRWINPCTGKIRPIKRGSMMGNLVSFPLLCLLNKACFDIASDIARGPGANRVGRFNGDDCVFAGNREFFGLWKEVTATYGLRVNVEKTGFSNISADLNSQSFFIRRGQLAPKPVLSFFRPYRKEPGCLLTEVLSGLSTCRGEVKSLVVNCLMRHEIAVRQIDLSTLSKRDYRLLSKKSWFRRALTDGPAPTIKKGVSRSVEMVVGPPPKAFLYPVFDTMAKDVAGDVVSQWRGVEVKPFKETIDYAAYRERSAQTPSYQPPSFRQLQRGPKLWSFVWPRPVYDHFKSFGDRVFVTENARRSQWIDDHPCLHVTMELVRSRFVRGSRNFRSYFGPPASLSPCSLPQVNCGYA